MFNIYLYKRQQARERKRRLLFSQSERRKLKRRVLGTNHYKRLENWAETHVTGDFAQGEFYLVMNEGLAEVQSPSHFLFRPTAMTPSMKFKDHSDNARLQRQIKDQESLDLTPNSTPNLSRQEKTHKFLHGNFAKDLYYKEDTARIMDNSARNLRCAYTPGLAYRQSTQHTPRFKKFNHFLKENNDLSSGIREPFFEYKFEETMRARSKTKEMHGDFKYTSKNTPKEAIPRMFVKSSEVKEKLIERKFYKKSIEGIISSKYSNFKSLTPVK